MPTWPLRIMAERFVKSWQDDRWLPNPFKSAVEVRRLVNGDTMMFFANESVEAGLNPVQQQAIDETVAYYRGIADGLRSGPFRFAVVLVPERMARLYTHLSGRARFGKVDRREIPQELDRSPPGSRHRRRSTCIRRRLREPDRAWRRFELPSFVRDDTKYHWKSRGIAAAADEIVCFPSGCGRTPD